LGLYEDIELQQNDKRELSHQNSMRIQYVKVQSNDINACAESYHYTETGQRVTDFEFSTLAVLSPSNAFQYQSQSLETHMALINNSPFKFRIVDQDNRPVILSMCVMEMQFYTKAYFSEADRGAVRHQKRQMYVHITDKQRTVNLGMHVK
jgi:hypothetical protein